MVPRSDVPRSSFRTQHTHKTTVHGGFLTPVFLDEALPGDTIKGEVTIFARMNTLLFPLMDHVTLETFAFFAPARLLWTNWRKMMGERDAPADSISYTTPVVLSPAGGWPIASLEDYLGLPVVGQMGGAATIYVNALPMRMYAFVYNEWFRDENLQNPIAWSNGDGPDTTGIITLTRRNKKHDYFTSALPWPLKGGTSVVMPLSGQAPVLGIGWDSTKTIHSGAGPTFSQTGLTGPVNEAFADYALGSDAGAIGMKLAVGGGFGSGTPQVFADLSQATGATIAALRLAVQTQRLLERDARSGTRYTEFLKAHFGVQPEDFRLQRPEYIGGGKSSLQTQAIPQTSATGLTGGTSPLAALSGQGTITGQHHWRYNVREHGYIMVLLSIDAELTYQQGLRRLWTRSTRYDYYLPVFAHLSEQIIRNDEIYVQGTNADSNAFGYQERWAEYRHKPSMITGLFRSTSAGTIDPWHSAQKFTALPTLNTTFIESNPPFSRNLAAGSGANNMQFLLDMLFNITLTRAMPIRSVPGGMDRF